MTRLSTLIVMTALAVAGLVTVPANDAHARGQLAAGGQVRGGDPFLGAAGTRCVVGFTVVGGFLTSGRCGRAGDAARALSGEVMGVFQASSFPGNDYAWVRLNAGWIPIGEVRTSPTTTVPVRGAISAPVGAAVCRAGPVSGWRCGFVVAKNQTVSYPQGVVTGLTRTNVCSAAGDTGGPFLAANQAQGITSGGSGTCTTGGTTFFQPVAEALAAYRLRLLTS